MVYVVQRQAPAYRKMSIDDFWFGDIQGDRPLSKNVTNTRTVTFYCVPEVITKKVSVDKLVQSLEDFNESAASLFEEDRASLYSTFPIAKKTGGLRWINSPLPQLKNALRALKSIFETEFGADLLYHTSAFAYIKGRCTLDAVKRHAQNESKWFAKLDLHDFFGSTTLEFVMKMFSMVFPFSEVVKTKRGSDALERALSLAFLDGGLPQGTPMSPLITNIMMIPVDHKLFNWFRGNSFVYTRYSDDFIISSRHHFDVRRVEGFISNTLRDFGATFQLNEKKTRYGSSAGSNWNLGLMLNKDNKITVGHKNKDRLRCTLANYAKDKRNGVQWSPKDVNAVLGLYSYYKMVEGEQIERLVESVSERHQMNIIEEMRADIS